MSKIYRATQVNNENYFRNFSDPETYLRYQHERSGDSVLHIAARFGHVNLIRLFLEKRSNPEICNHDGKRPLHEAAHAGQLVVVKFLLEFGVEIDCLKRADWTPLMLACTKTNIDIIKELLVKGGNPVLKNKDGWNSFHIAAREGSVEIAQLLLKYNGRLWDTVSKNDRSPLHTAALHGCGRLVNFLLETCDYPTDMTDTCGSTPLMDALRAGHVDTAKLLIDLHKADVTKEDKLGRQPVHLVAEAGQLEGLRFLLDSYPTVCVDSPSSYTHSTPQHVAAKEGQELVMEDLVLRGTDVNLLDTSLRSALHIASGAQHAGCVELLFKHGAHDTPDSHGKMARDMARKNNVIQTFEKYSSDVT